MFGWDVELSGNDLLVGAIGQNTSSLPGVVYAFSKSVSGEWQQNGKLAGTDSVWGDYFGEHIAFFGSTAVVTATLNGVSSEGSYGAIYVFVSDSQGTWVSDEKLTLADDPERPQIGSSISLYDNTILAGVERGAPCSSPSGTRCGSALEFVQVGSSWVQGVNLVASDGTRTNGGGTFGQAVAVWENRALVGANGDNITLGAAYVYVRGEDGSWTELARLSGSGQVVGDLFGQAVDIDGTTGVVSSKDAIYVFDLR